VLTELEGAQGWLLKLDNAPKGIARLLVKAFVKIGLGLVNHLKEEELSGQALHVRTGHGRRSVTYRVFEEGNESIAVVAGPDLRKAPYMRAHDKGATIVPKRVGNLTIPIGEALTGKGVSRFTARQLIDNPTSYGYVGTFTHNRIIFGKKSNGNTVPLFVLKTSVRLKAVGFMAHTLSEKKAWADSVVEDAVSKGIDGSE
jgi:hypothetical protein